MTGPKIEKYERMLHAMPREFRHLATWAWTELQADIFKHAIAAGASRELAAVMASRLARLVAGQMYQDITLARQMDGAPKQ
jgi:hypothetical protein